MEKVWEQRCIPTERAGGKLLIVVLSDVSEARALQQQVVRVERLAASGEMARVVAHTFRNAMTSFKMVMQVLKERNTEGENADKSIGVALRSLERMEGIVSSLLRFSRPGAPRLNRASLKEPVENSLIFVKHLLLESGVTVDCDIADDLPEVWIDEAQIQEALVNLLVNAGQALPKGGRIRISVSRNSSVPLPGGVDIEVSDNGPGIIPENLARTCDPFFTTRREGTGLGLAIVQRTVEEHGGNVSVESEPGTGKRVRLTLPASVTA